MTTRIVFAAHLIAMLCGLVVVSSAAPASARGAAASIMSSPGYQRALAESRKPATTPVTTTVQPTTPTTVKRHRHHN